MAIRIVTVDAFTDVAFAGNPAAVCVLPEPRPEEWMRNVAREMNLSETAFLLSNGDGFHLRWFTPAVEVDLCGHATVASAHALWENGHAPRATLTFTTRSGTLSASPLPSGEVELDFPAKPATPCDPPAGLLDALGAVAVAVGRNSFDFLVEVASEADVRGLKPDFRKLAAVACRGVIVTAPSNDPAYDFVSRFFAPASGIDEDPVTG